MNILFTRFPFESAYGGAENQTRWLMNGLRDGGHAVSFLGSCPVLLEYCKEDGIPATELDIGPPPVSKGAAFTFLWRQKKMCMQLESAFKSAGKIDVVCMLSLSEKLLLTPIATEADVQTVWIEHDSVGRWLTMNPYLATIKRLSHNVTTVGVSHLSREMYVDIGWPEDTFIAIPNGIDPKIGVEAASIQKESHDRLRIGCVARLEPEKGVDLLPEVVMEIPEAELTVVGKGAHEDEIGVIAEQLNVHDRFEIVHRLPSLASFYKNCDIFILPSRSHDPFGLVAAEAMLCGAPVVVTDACGIANELTHGENAIIVKADDVQALRDGVDQLLDENLRAQIATAGQRLAEEKFSIEKMVDAYESIWN